MKKIEETREHIIAVASGLFQKFGFDKTSMDDIARHAHKAKRSLYYHFPNKEDLFKTVINKELNTAQKELQSIFDDTNLLPLERIRKYMIRRMELFAQAGTYQQTLLYDVQNFGEIRFSEMDNQRRSFDDWERESFKKMAEGGGKDFDCNAFADMLQMVLKSLDISFFVQGKYDKYEQTFLTLTNLIITGIMMQVKSC